METAEISQLNAITVDSFRHIEIGKISWFCTTTEDEFVFDNCMRIPDHYNSNNEKFKNWIKKWNTEGLSKLNLSKQTSFSIRSLEKGEARAFETVKNKMLQAKKFAMNYWENKIFDELN